MKTKTTVAQASEKRGEKKRLKVQIQLSTVICTGYIYCPGQRLLDVLNGVLAGELRVSDEFLSVSEAEMRSPDGTEATVQSAYINKANILFVKESGGGGTRGLDGEGAPRRYYPFVEKLSAPVKLLMPFFTLTGRMYYAKNQRLRHVLNSGPRFLPLTNVDICPSAGGNESGVSFIAVNKGQIIFMQELEGSRG